MAEKEPSQRQLRVAEEIKKIIARFIDRGEVHNLEGIDTLVTITKVTVSPDLKYCKAYISVLAGEEQARDTIQGLKSAEGFIRTRLAKMVNLRNTPEVSFVLDQSIEYGVRMSRLIDEVAEEDAKKGKESQERSQTDGNS